MSTKYPGGIISKTAPVPTGPYENGTAPGVWTLEQQAEFVKQGIWPLAGNTIPYIEDVFQTWLYTGNGSTQTINNGIDLAGKGGLVWGKVRNSGSGNDNNYLYDTLRGTGAALFTNLTSAQSFTASGVSAFNSNGFEVTAGRLNDDTFNYASWTFREQPKFFDIVTWTGNGANRTIAHNLGSVPGMIIVKRTDASADWQVYHRSLANTEYMVLNSTAAKATGATRWNSTTPTSTVFSLGTDATVNASGGTYVAYVYAHDAGGFGLTGTDNVISCGSFTTDGSGNARVDLGYEPQWILVKRSNASNDWFIVDNMRGLNQTNNYFLRPNLSNAEFNNDFAYYKIDSTGFNVSIIQGSGNTVVYIAIRRGPMRVPTTGTSVFAPATATWSGGAATYTTNFPVDLALARGTRFATDSAGFGVYDRLRGPAPYLKTAQTDAELSADSVFDSMTSFTDRAGYTNGTSGALEALRRAPGFFDVVCFNNTGTSQSIAHGLSVAPELLIVKSRTGSAQAWWVYHSAVGATKYLLLNSNAAPVTTDLVWNNTAPSGTAFTTGTIMDRGGYVAYLFATCPGVSKVGSFTGTGATQVINCGFTGGARFVLIKATSTTGDWLVWDSARGIVAGNDPYLAMNSTAAEVTSTDWVDTASTGFELSNAGGNLANSSGVSYIFLAIA
jgi:hypothetical protein